MSREDAHVAYFTGAVFLSCAIGNLYVTAAGFLTFGGLLMVMPLMIKLMRK